MPVEQAKFGLLSKDGSMSGFQLSGHIWIVDNTIYYTYMMRPVWDMKLWIKANSKILPLPTWDKLIQFSPFTDKKGRQLKEGDRVKDKYGNEFVVELVYAHVWHCQKTKEPEKTYGDFLFNFRQELEYTGSIYLPE